jgi:hypothetical protein
MAFVIADRVKTTATANPGTSSSVTLNASPSTGYVAFSTIGNGSVTYYTISTQNANDWEVGIGTYSSTGPTLTRDTVLSNSLGTTARIDFNTGTQDVFITYPAERAVYQDNGNAIIPGQSGAVYLTAQTITSDTTIPSGYNGIVAGSLQVANGTTLTVANGSIAVIVA